MPATANTATLDPALVTRAWPADAPLVALLGLDTTLPTEHRFPTIAARPERTLEIKPAPDAFDRIDAALGACRRTAPHAGGGWAVELDYELAAAAEPTAFPLTDRATPAARLHRVEGGARFDHATRRWSSFGSPTLADEALDHLARDAPPASRPTAATLGEVRSSAGRVRYEAAVRRAVELIRAGDCFQVNLAHALHARTSTHPRDAFARLAGQLLPGFAGFFEPSGGQTVRTVLSASPELFLAADPASGATDLSGARVVTRPIKGTRARGAHAELGSSAKDNAELAMIVDLMRNDLGRVAEPGTVLVDRATALEHHHASAGHGGVSHTVATVGARLRGGTTVGGLLRAAFAPGSVTGAPKVRAMQIIGELERSAAFPARGAYCGALGWIGDDGAVSLSVAIRTATMERAGGGSGGWRFELPVGAGIVADSDPASEWEETLVKAAPILHALGAVGGVGP